MVVDRSAIQRLDTVTLDRSEIHDYANPALSHEGRVPNTGCDPSRRGLELRLVRRARSFADRDLRFHQIQTA